MAGRHRKNKGSSRDDFHNTHDPDQSPNNHTRLLRTFGPVSQDEPGRRSRTQRHNPSSGIHRCSDDSNPVLNTRCRNLKRQSDIVKRDLEDLTEMIDELQPDSAAMDWSGSADIIVYVLVACAVDGTFQHPQMRSISNGSWLDTPAAFTPHAEALHRGMSTSATQPIASRSSTMPQHEGSGAARSFGIMGQSRSFGSTTGDKIGGQVQFDVIECGTEVEKIRTLASMQQSRFEDSNRESISACTLPERLSREGISNWGGQRTNQSRAAVTSLLTPPPSPIQTRRGSWML